MDSIGLPAHEVSAIDASEFASSRLGDKSISEEKNPATEASDEVKQIRECAKLVETLTGSLKEASAKLEVMQDTVRKTNALSDAWLSLWLNMTQLQRRVLRPAPRKVPGNGAGRRGGRDGRRVSSRRSSMRPGARSSGNGSSSSSSGSSWGASGRGGAGAGSGARRRSSMAPTSSSSSSSSSSGRRSLVGKAPVSSRQSLPVGASRRLVGKGKGNKGTAGRPGRMSMSAAAGRRLSRR